MSVGLRRRVPKYVIRADFIFSPHRQVMGMTCDRTTTAAAAMERFGKRGMALLPWTKQMLTVLWEHLWIVVRVIYCTFLSVFQLFRFEVHFQITDEMVQHSQAESFLFSSLFDGDAGVMVGHPNGLSDLCGGGGADDDGGMATAEALLSGLAPDDGVYMGFHSDWNIFPAFSNEALFQEDSVKDVDGGEFDNQEPMSTCNDPYDLLLKKPKADTIGDKVEEEMSGLKMWVRRSDSDSSWSSSDVSDADLEENERLLEFFSMPDDPYNPMCFTACTVSKVPQPVSAGNDSEVSGLASSSDEEEELWTCLDRKDDPYHPLNFQACLSNQQLQNSQQPGKNTPSKHTAPKTFQKPTQCVPRHSEHVKRVPWKRPTQRCQTPETRRPDTRKKREVRFSPVVEVHVMWAWRFAAAASRKGPWEEMARDRERFRRRVGEAERAIGCCLEPAHRARMRTYVHTRTNAG
ncbi:uncharacterized protein LOC144053805 [Vanacampus margaritifer]